MVAITPRKISSSERAVLERILEGESPEATRLREQVSSLMVVARCECGCPTVEFATPGRAPDAVALPIGLEGQVPGSADQPPGDILVFVTNEQLSGLELVSYGDETPTDWPAVDTIEVRTITR